MRRLYAAALVAALVTVAGCSAVSPEPAPAAPSPFTSSSSAAEPTASVMAAWKADDVRVRPDWVGRDAPWVWEYSDDIVVIGPRGLVALDRETGSEVWRLPLDGQVCGATRSPSEIGLVAVAIGRCEAGTTARRTTVKVVDLESASVVWQRPFVGSPQLDLGGDVLVAASGCGARRLDLSTGAPLGRIDASCADRVLVGHGTILVSSLDPRRWRAIEVKSGTVVAEVTGPGARSVPRRILTADPLTVLARPTHGARVELVRFDAEDLRLLTVLSSAAVAGFFAWSGDSLVLADRALPGATEFSVQDGSSLGGFPGVPAARWIPFDLYGDGILGFEGGGRLTLRSLHDGSATTLGEVGDGETGPAASGHRAIVIDDVLLMPGHGNNGVVAYRLTLPDD